MIIKSNKSNIYLKHNLIRDRIPLLFIHGFTGSSSSWNNILKKIGHPTIALDIPGHGKSHFNNNQSD